MWRTRVTRGLLASAACTLLAFAGHADAGGALPRIGALALLALPLTALTILLADRRRAPLTILAVVAGSQLALHEALQLLAAPPPDTGTGPMPDMPGMTMVADGTTPPGMSPLLMTGAHVLATLITAAVLSGAEEAALACACALVEALVPARVRALPPPVERPARLVLTPIPPNPRLRGVLARRVNLRRGPPLPA